MPAPDGERIAALETAFKAMRDDMADLKRDVRSLVEAFNMGKGRRMALGSRYRAAPRQALTAASERAVALDVVRTDNSQHDCADHCLPRIEGRSDQTTA